MHRNAARLLLPVLGVGAIALLGVAIWSSTAKPHAQSTSTAAPSVPSVASDTSAQVRTSTVHGSSAGYDAKVQITRTGAGPRTLTSLDILLSTQATPASAPSAEAQLVGADHVRHDVPLTIVGAGRWTSQGFTIAAGRYTLTTRFDRSGAPIIIAVTIVLT